MVQLVDQQSIPTFNRLDSAHRKHDGGRFTTDDVLNCPEEKSKQRLANELASELWSRLPISRASVESGDREIEYIIRVAMASSAQISTWYQELSDFVPAIARAATEYRGEVPAALKDQLATDIESQMLEQVRYPLPNRSFIDFRFADLPPAEAWAQTHRLLEEACLEFANRVISFFDSLQQKKVVGGIQKTSSTCRFTFFRRVAIAKNSQITTEKLTRHLPNFQSPDRIVLLEETLQKSECEIQHRQAQCIHHVRNPVFSNPRETVYPLPQKYSRLLNSCPDWMAGSLRVLEGELFREECIEWGFHSETLTTEEVIGRRVIERVRRDPAVVFGPYILAGWGELEITEEENRRRDVQVAAERIATAGKARLTHIGTFLVAGSAIAVVPFTGSATAVTTAFAILLGFVAMAVAGYAAHLASVARGRLSAGPVIRHCTLIGATVFAVQGLLFSVLHWSLPAFGMAVLAALIAAIAVCMKSAKAELDRSSVG